jgi:hypothetical protein
MGATRREIETMRARPRPDFFFFGLNENKTLFEIFSGRADLWAKVAEEGVNVVGFLRMVEGRKVTNLG